jgi:hypothetical protein
MPPWLYRIFAALYAIAGAALVRLSGQAVREAQAMVGPYAQAYLVVTAVLGVGLLAMAFWMVAKEPRSSSR